MRIFRKRSKSLQGHFNAAAQETTCMCGAPLTPAQWRVPTPEKMITVNGMACATDGCSGNHPQQYAKLIKVCREGE